MYDIEALKLHLPFGDTYFDSLSCQQMSVKVSSSKSLLKVIIICGIKYTIAPTSTIHNRGIRRIQECYKESTNFDQSIWLIKDLSVERGGLRNDPQKGDNTFI